ncbi:MAG: hypothetical protein ACI9OD_001547, partial [Limisphaerales bacterium]
MHKPKKWCSEPMAQGNINLPLTRGLIGGRNT